MFGEGAGLFSLIKNKMAWASARHSVLARNIANASTPGYAAQDVAQPNFSRALKAASAPMVTNARHLSGAQGAVTSGLGGGALRARTVQDGEATPDGNSVNLEEQMMRVADTQMQYQEALSLYRKGMSMWRSALGSRG